MNVVNFSTWDLSKSQQRIADYIQKHLDLIPYMNEKEIAKACNISVATVSRFWKAIGFLNLKEFKQHLKQETAITPASKVEAAVKKHSSSHGQVIFDHAVQCLNETKHHLSERKFQQATAALANAKRIHLYGAGSAQSLVCLFSFRLKRFNGNVFSLPPSGHEIFEAMIHMEKGDVLVIFGFVQASVEINVLLDFAQKQGVCTILMTDLLVSPMLERATYVLYTSRGDAGDFHSMAAPVAMIESMIINVSKKMGNDAFDKLHNLHQIRKDYQNRLPRKG
ncbi:MurR/RpiR family transcriptional regulator [Siminovitchia sp. FSL H7-0308]|uniref:MurR/RpiR family transcriptional regulator n=1 Tax=unclassified Siminovitchia TaxID=2837530 RepID=UPI0030CBAF22